MKKRLVCLFLALMTVFSAAAPACAESGGESVAAQETVTYEAAKLAAPKISKVENTKTGVKVTWGKVSGAFKYRLYYKKDGTSWKKIADTTKTSYTWKKAKSGTKYSFRVRALDSKGKLGSASGSKSIIYLSAPKMKSVENTTSGVKLSWNKVTGAAKYRVYYKIEDGEWKKIADTTKTSYTWKKAKSGTKYTFTVRALSSSGKTLSGYDETGKSITTPEESSSADLPTPVITKLKNTANGIKISWGKVENAAKYRVYYRTKGEWLELGDTSKTSYTWTEAKSGTEYSFTVRCISSTGKSYTSGYDEIGKSITYVAAPVIDYVYNEVDGITISWLAINGAAEYRVYIKTGSGNWTKLADTAKTSFFWSEGTVGTSYSFTVCCLDGNGACISAYDETGVSLLYACPKITSVEIVDGGIEFQWDYLYGAALYQLLYKTDSGNWKTIKGAEGLYGSYYVWPNPESGKTYTFTVRGTDYSGDYVGGYDPVGVSLTYVATPKIKSVSNTDAGLKVTWGKVTGADKYRVFYKTRWSDGWKKLADTADTSYIYQDVKNGMNYSFTVRCLDSNGAYVGLYDTKGKEGTYLTKDTVANGTCGYDGDNLVWTLSDKGTLTISGKGSMSYFAPWPVPWSEYKEDIIRVVIENGATNICESAFKDCTNMISATIPKSVTVIKEEAFLDCQSLTKLTISKGVTTIGDDCFGGCTSLKKLTIPEGVTYIGAQAFSYCRGLTEITIPSTVKTIEDWTFQACSSLESVTIPKSVTSIGRQAFDDCRKLKEIVIMNSQCKIASGGLTLGVCGTTTVVGYKGSTAEKYAKNNGYKFKALS